MDILNNVASLFQKSYILNFYFCVFTSRQVAQGDLENVLL